jgi:hypothetical protein
VPKKKKTNRPTPNVIACIAFTGVDLPKGYHLFNTYSSAWVVVKEIGRDVFGRKERGSLTVTRTKQRRPLRENHHDGASLSLAPSLPPPPSKRSLPPSAASFCPLPLLSLPASSPPNARFGVPRPRLKAPPFSSPPLLPPSAPLLSLPWGCSCSRRVTTGLLVRAL